LSLKNAVIAALTSNDIAFDGLDFRALIELACQSKSKIYLCEWDNAVRKRTTALVEVLLTLARGERRRELAGKAGGSFLHHVGRPCSLGFCAGRDCRGNGDLNGAGLS
jgi:hypothetical protein